jgi:hypothetical protein
MKITNVCVMLLLMISNAGYSQYFRLGKANEVSEVKGRPLLLMLEEEDPKVISKLSKNSAELESYKNEIKRVNEELTAIVNKFWSFNDLPTIKTKTEINKLKGEKNKQYAVLSLNRVKVTSWAKDGAYRYAIDSKVIATMFIDLIENLDKGNPVYYQNLPNVFPTQGDMALGIQMMQNFLQARLDGKKRNEISDEANENKSLLVGKTLLIDREDIKTGLTQAQIKEAYPYAFKVVSYKEIEDAILERDKNYAIVQIIPLMVGVPANAHIVINTEDGKSMGYYAPVQATVMGKNTESRITQRHLKNYAK